MNRPSPPAWPTSTSILSVPGWQRRPNSQTIPPSSSASNIPLIRQNKTNKHSKNPKPCSASSATLGKICQKVYRLTSLIIYNLSTGVDVYSEKTKKVTSRTTCPTSCNALISTPSTSSTLVSILNHRLKTWLVMLTSSNKLVMNSANSGCMASVSARSTFRAVS